MDEFKKISLSKISDGPSIHTLSKVYAKPYNYLFFPNFCVFLIKAIDLLSSLRTPITSTKKPLERSVGICGEGVLYK